MLLTTNISSIEFVNVTQQTSRVVSWSIMIDNVLSLQWIKALVGFMVAKFSEYMLSQIIDMMIRYEKFVSKNSCRFEVYIGYNYRIM